MKTRRDEREFFSVFLSRFDSAVRGTTKCYNNFQANFFSTAHSFGQAMPMANVQWHFD